jgi:hypothetical protein
MNEAIKTGFSALTLGLSCAGTALVAGTVGYFTGKAVANKRLDKLEQDMDQLRRQRYTHPAAQTTNVNIPPQPQQTTQGPHMAPTG